MRVDQAVTELHRAGYRANAHATLPGYVVVLDPINVLGTCEAPSRIEYKRVSFPAAHVFTFIQARA